jgi:hypothetical protein
MRKNRGMYSDGRAVFRELCGPCGHLTPYFVSKGYHCRAFPRIFTARSPFSSFL